MERAALPAGPRFWPLDAWLFLHRPKRYYRTLRRRFGDLVTLRTSQGPLVLALSSEGARHVLGTTPEGLGAFQTKVFGGLTGSGSLWVLEGERHRCERRLLSPPFHAAHLRHYSQVIQESVDRHTEKWQAGQTIRVYDAMLDVSLDMILRAVLGIGDGVLMDEGRRVSSNLMRAATPWICFSAACQSWWFPPWTRFRRASREFVAFLARCLEERRASGNDTYDVLGLMLAARGADGTAMRDEDIRDELATILVSGHETTAIALSWAVYELARHPAVLTRLRAELDAIEPDPDKLARQPYLGAVCDEALRLHPILTEVARMIAAPLDVLGCTLPPGAGVGVAICSIHQDPSIYPAPEQFVPERFLERTYSPFEFLPFGGGHRRCLGAAFSDYEMRIALATVVTRWEFELGGVDCEVRHNIAMGPKHGIRLRVKGRRRQAEDGAG